MLPSRNRAPLALALLTWQLIGCSDLADWSNDADAPLSKQQRAELTQGQRVPNTSEIEATGAMGERVRRGSRSFSRLQSCRDCPLRFKDEEGNDSDRMMTPRLRTSLVRLAALVKQTWPKLELRVTEAWDEDREHGSESLHYEGRAADLTTSDQDQAKLGRLAALAVAAKFDWVLYEDESHVHASVRR